MKLTTVDLISIVALIASLTAALAATLALYRSKRHTEYSHARRRAELEMLRRSLEGDIYGLTRDMVATERRWRDANHLLVSSQQQVVEEGAAPRKVPFTRFLRAAGLEPHELTTESDLVFVLTPFHPEYADTFQTIYSVCREVGLRCLRGDEEFVEGDLLPHILRLIVRARIIIANIDGRNPNVFYELGIAHALDKLTILVGTSAFEAPFDLRSKKLILFEDEAELRERLKDELTRTLVRG